MLLKQALRQHIVKLTVASAVAALPVAAMAESVPQGVYSADQLLDAEVYTAAATKHVGELDDIIFDNEMQIAYFVIETGDILGLAGKSYVVGADQIRVELADTQAVPPDYNVMIGMTAEELKQQPVYSTSWWTSTQEQARQAWQNTKEGVSSAWTFVKQGGKSLYEGAQETVHSVAESVADATTKEK